VSEILAIGVSHKTAPVAVRERLALPPGRAVDFLRDLRGDSAVREAVAISTCNRTELYLVAGDPVEAETAALGMLARQAGIRPTELASAIYALRNCEAARHLFRVTSGLESMIVGEAEVQGQVKRAYEAAVGAGTAGPMTHRLFRAALQTGKRVRSETLIGERQGSVPSVAAGLARDELGELEGREVVILGAGETSELAARALSHHGVATIFVANRRQDRALGLARRFGGEAVSFDDLPGQLERVDIVVSATASPHAILGVEEMVEVMEARSQRPLLMIDLAVPRDIDPDCAEIPGVSLHDIDDLQAVVASNRSVRQAEAKRAEGVLEEEIQRFAGWLGSPTGQRAGRRRARRECGALGDGLRARPPARRGDRADGRQPPAARAHRADEGSRRRRPGSRADAAPARAIRDRVGGRGRATSCRAGS